MQVAFVKSFEAVYCFLPLMVKVLFIGQVGAGLLRRDRGLQRLPAVAPSLPAYLLALFGFRCRRRRRCCC